tara:strand:- start:214 stop:1134 length:921 start_codon:yes stop_codon:yes gene_type:complete
MNRIVSLIASSTEIVCRLGLRDELVGVSHECDFPGNVSELAVCSKPRIDVNGTSREIDDRVKTALKDALSVYEVRRDVLIELDPTIIITQTQCDVCAVNLKDVEAAVCDWLGTQPAIVSLEPNELSDVWTDIQRVADAAGVAGRGRDLVTELQTGLAEIRERSSKLKERPTVACIEWMDPLMAAGNWIPELVEIAGGRSLFGVAGKHSPWMTWDELVAADPDLIITTPCGFDIGRTLEEIHLLTERPGWSDLKAVRNQRAYVTDGNAYFNRPGPRLLESTRILAELFHPGEFPAEFEGHGWIPIKG